jgi:hypothetical protein
MKLLYSLLVTLSLSACVEPTNSQITDAVTVAATEPAKATVPAKVPEPAQPEATKPADPVTPTEPRFTTVCLDIQGRDGQPVIDPATGRPRQNCTRVRIRERHQGTRIEDAVKK